MQKATIDQRPLCLPTLINNTQIWMSMSIYTIKKELLSSLQPPEIKRFFEEFEAVSEAGNIDIEYSQRGYSVNSEVKGLNFCGTHAIGFFSGAGGLDIGAQLAGTKVISSMDYDLDSVSTMKANPYFNHTHHINEDIQKLSALQYKDTIRLNNPEKLILIGGPPCQPFSKAGYWVTDNKRLGSDDPRNMIGQYLRMVAELQPDGFILENVESLLHPKNKVAVDELKETINRIGYNFIMYNGNALNFGVPQKRKRVFFIASKKSLKGEPLKTHGSPQEILLDSSLLPYERVIDWIGKFDDAAYYEKEESTTGKTYEHELKQVPPGKNYFALTARDSHPEPKFEANKRFWSFLLKLHPCRSSWTIAAQPGPWVGPLHWQNRRLRVPEIAALQTFPQDYKFCGTRRSVQRQIGNAVPSLMGQSIVKFLMENV
jgi:DNA (cytosine-5)-methyltransferase 1